jgi:hypothetical protein
MDFLRTHVFISFAIAILYFIMKSFQKKMYKDDSIESKKIFRDALAIFGISYGCLIFRDNLTMIDNPKAQVFTSEPNF